MGSRVERNTVPEPRRMKQTGTFPSKRNKIGQRFRDAFDASAKARTGRSVNILYRETHSGTVYTSEGGQNKSTSGGLVWLA